jgi:D-3-phosphoglycerate dehydrogenase
MKIIHVDKNNPLLINNLEKQGHENIIAYKKTKSEILKIIHNYDGLIIRSRFTIDKPFLIKSKKLKFIARVGSGTENIDIDFAKSLKIKIISAPKGNCNAVGEHALGMLLSLINNINIAEKSISNGKWQRKVFKGTELKSKVIGIIGFGNTGKSFAEKLKGFNSEIIYYDIKKIKSNDLFKQVELSELTKRSNIVSLHIPQTKSTIKMINKSFIKKMKKQFWIINTSRGKIIETKDLVWGLKNKKILGAALDVLEYEASSFEKLFIKKNKELDYLINSDKVILTPHVAGLSEESEKKLAKIISNKIKQI